MFKKIGSFIACLTAIVVVGVQSVMAATPWIDVSSIEVDTAPVATLGLTVLAALAAIWVLRKLIKTTNKS